MTIYLLSGLGADNRLFNGLTFSESHRVVHLPMPVPTHRQTMASYAKQISTGIDPTEEFILIGVSLGGMVAREISAFLKPKKVILISSAQHRSELPPLYRFMGRLKVNRLVPGWLTKYSAFVLQPLFENDSWKDRRFFRSMLLTKPSSFYKRTVDMIVNWDRNEGSPDIIHIHGTGDRTLPFKLVKPAYAIERGSHMMVYTRAKEVNSIIRDILK